MSSEQKTFVINTMSEAKYLELSARSAISDKQLNIVDDNNTNRTVVASYDLLGKKIDELKKDIYDPLSTLFYDIVKTTDKELGIIDLEQVMNALSGIYCTLKPIVEADNR